MSALIRVGFLVAGVALLAFGWAAGSTSAVGAGLVLALASLVHLDEWGNYKDRL